MASFSNLSHAKLLIGTLFSILVFVGDLSHKNKILWTICNCLDDHLLPVLRAGPFAYSIYMLSYNFPPIPVTICLGQASKIELLKHFVFIKIIHPMLVSCLGVLQHYFPSLSLSRNLISTHDILPLFSKQLQALQDLSMSSFEDLRFTYFTTVIDAIPSRSFPLKLPSS